MQAALREDQLQQYAVVGDLDAAAGGRVPASGLVSVAKPAGEGGKGSQLYKKGKHSGQGKQGPRKKHRTQ